MKKAQGYRTDHATARFIDFVGKSMKDDLVKDLLSVHYYAILTDGSIFEKRCMSYFYYLHLNSQF